MDPKLIDLVLKPSLTYQKELLDLCEPILKYLKFSVFNYTRFYPTLDFFCLTTNPYSTQAYWENHLYKYDVHLTESDKYFSGYFFWDTDYDQEVNKKFSSICFPDIDITCGVYYFNKTKSYAEAFIFYGNHIEHLIEIRKYYLNLLDNFIEYFNSHSQPLIEFANQNLSNVLSLASSFIEDQQYFKSDLPNAQSDLINIAEYQKMIAQKAEKISENSIDPITRLLPGLTKRQSECAHWMLLGKTAEETGMILNLSRRTVESYIDNMKKRLECYTKSDLIYKLVQLSAS